MEPAPKLCEHAQERLEGGWSEAGVQDDQEMSGKEGEVGAARICQELPRCWEGLLGEEDGRVGGDGGVEEGGGVGACGEEVEGDEIDR